MAKAETLKIMTEEEIRLKILEERIKELKAHVEKEKDNLPIDTPVTLDNVAVEKESWKKHSKWNFFHKRGLKFRDKRKLQKYPEKAFLIKMFFSNGTAKEWVIVSKEEVFQYKKRTYHLRWEDIYFNITQNQFELNYHEDFFEPIGRKIVKQGNKAFFSITPENVKPYLEQRYVQVLVEATNITKLMKFILIMSLFSLIMGLVNIYYVKDFGKTLELFIASLGALK